MNRVNVNDVIAFVAVVETGGFRTAAQKRGLSASSLSDSVRRLESNFNVRLLNRTTRSVTPTNAGERLLARLRPALGEIERAFDDVGDEEGWLTGSVRLNVPSIVARQILPPIAVGFLKAYPGVRLEVFVDDNLVDVLAAGFDAGIRYEEHLAKDMIAVSIGPKRQRFIAAAARSYLDIHGTPTHPRDLVKHVLIGHRFPSGALSIWEFEQEGKVVRVSSEGPLISSIIDVELAAAVAGVGILYGFEEFLAADVERGALVPILQDWWQSFPGPSLYYQTRKYMPPALRAFVDYVTNDRRAPPSNTHR